MREINISMSQDTYTCQHEWPENCSVQCGNKGMVFTSKGGYATAFFEAFPKELDTFIRGEGETVKEAEQDAWEQLQKYLNCNKHEFERKGYTNGSGVCKNCGLFQSDIFEPSTKCVVCKRPTNWTRDINSDYYCKEHVDQIPEDKKTFIHKKINNDDFSIEDGLNMLFNL